MSVLAVIRRMQEQNSNGYNVIVRDGSMKTALIIMILIQVKDSVHFVDFSPLPFFLCQYLLYCT